MAVVMFMPRGKYHLKGDLMLGIYRFVQSEDTNRWNIIHIGKGYMLLDKDVHEITLYADTIVCVRIELQRMYLDLKSNSYVNPIVAKAFWKCEKYRHRR